MKTIVKIEIAILVVVVLVATGMILLSEGFLDWFRDPMVIEQNPVPVATDAPTDATVPEEAGEEPEETADPEETDPVQTEAQTDAEPRDITATRYFAYDIREGEYLKLQGEADEKLYPASITKLLTAYVVLAYMEPEDTVTVGDAMNLVQEDSSVANLQVGDTLTVEQLIAAMMLPSGNDAAQVASVAAGRAITGREIGCQEAVTAFVDEMNKQAQSLGMTNSHFENPDGFHHDNHYTSMNDLVRLCETVLADPVILKYTSRASDSVLLPDRTLEWKNTNMLLHSDLDCYIPNTIGLKTGYTEKAGSCLMSAFFMEDRLLLIGVFGCPPHTMDRYLDVVAIYNSL